MALRAVVASAALIVSTAGLTAGVGPASADTPDPAPGDVTVTTTDDGVEYEDASLGAEDTTTVEGTLRITAIDRVDGGAYAYAIETARGDVVALDVAEDLPLAAAGGDIEAEVVDAGAGDAQLAEATVDTARAAAAPAGAAHRAYVVLVPRTGTLPAESAAATRLDDQVLDEWVDEAGGAISDFTVAGTATLAASAPATLSKTTLCTMSSSATLWAAGAAQFPGVDFGQDSSNHLIMLISGSGCAAVSGSVLGLGTVGAGIGNGGKTILLWDTDYVDATGVHELGHNFGLGHANVVAADGDVTEYLDIFSVMGFGIAGASAPALDSEFRDQLGLTVPGEIEQVDRGQGTTTLTRTLAPRGSGSGLRGLEVVDPFTDQTYWVELRAGDADRDAGSAYADPRSWILDSYRFRPGVTITQRGDNDDLDLLPHEAGATDEAAWRAGDSMTPASGGMTIAVDGVTASSATVTVTLTVGTAAIATNGTTGAARVGGVADAVTGDWPDGTTFTHRWTVDGVLVSTDPTFAPTSSQRGHTLGLTVRATVPDLADPVDRAARPVTIGYGVFATATPTISGTVKVHRTLVGTAGDWTPAASSYRWQYYSKGAWRDISGATRTTYKISSRYAGKKLRFRAKGTSGGYTSIYRYSSSTTTVKK